MKRVEDGKKKKIATNEEGETSIHSERVQTQ